MILKRTTALLMSLSILLLIPRYSSINAFANEGDGGEYQKALNFGHSYASALKNDDSLYTWGRNQEGALGRGDKDSMNGKTEYSVVSIKFINAPEKIADNIVTADMSINDHGAYINVNHELYMWGRNSEGQLGTGDYKHKLSPVKIMDNVRSVGLGNRCSAAVTDGGELYVWGSALCRNENVWITRVPSACAAAA